MSGGRRKCEAKEKTATPEPQSAGARAGSGSTLQGLRLGNVALKDLYNLLFRHGADDLLGHLSALKHEEGRNTANIEFARGINILIHVELYYLQLAGIFARDLLDRRRKHVARAAPIRPKVDHDGLRLARLNHVGLKVCIINCLDVVCPGLPLSARHHTAIAFTLMPIGCANSPRDSGTLCRLV